MATAKKTTKKATTKTATSAAKRAKTEKTVETKTVKAKTVKPAKIKESAEKEVSQVTKKRPVWQIILVVLGVILVLGSIGFGIWLMVVPQHLIKFKDVEDFTATKLDNGVWKYEGTIEKRCVLDQAVLSIDAVTTPTEKVETLVCNTDEIEGTYSQADGGKLEIQYPGQDGPMISRSKIFEMTRGESLTEKKTLEEYTENLVNRDGKISFQRGIERITEDGKAITYVPSEDSSTGWQATSEEINGGEGFTYQYVFKLTANGETRAMYYLTVKLSFADEDKDRLEEFSKQAEERRAEIRKEWDEAPVVSYDDLVDKWSEYEGKLVKVKGKVDQLSSSGKVCAVVLTTKKSDPITMLGQTFSLDKTGDAIVKNCVYTDGKKAQEGDQITVTGKAVEQSDGPWKGMPYIQIDAVEVTK